MHTMIDRHLCMISLLQSAGQLPHLVQLILQSVYHHQLLNTHGRHLRIVVLLPDVIRSGVDIRRVQ